MVSRFELPTRILFGVGSIDRLGTEARLRLRDLGCELEHAEEIAELVLKSSRSISAHPRPLDAAAIAQIYRDSF